MISFILFMWIAPLNLLRDRYYKSLRRIGGSAEGRFYVW